METKISNQEVLISSLQSENREQDEKITAQSKKITSLEEESKTSAAATAAYEEKL